MKWTTVASVLCVACSGALCRADVSEAAFASPPPSARPWVYWFPLDGNITSNGITADLEAMARVGIGGVLYMETAQGTPKGPVPFASEAWFALMNHACREATRLGLQINMNNDAGWCGSGGPWIAPEQSMQRVVWSVAEIAGPARRSEPLPQPQAEKGYYRDIAVYAYPTPAQKFRLPQLKGKSAEVRAEVPLRAAYPDLPAGACVPRGQVVDLTGRMGADGRLDWEAPAGRWTVLRLGHTTTGKDNHPAPEGGRGLECDKLSQAALATHYEHLMGRLVADNRSMVGADKALVRTHIDSWETHSQNWTPRFVEEFQRLRGYDPRPLLPVMAGCVIDGAEVSERFLWDVRQTIADLLLANYADHLRALAGRSGLGLSIEAYGDGPFDNVAFAGRADEPMSEFWSWTRYGAAESCIEMSSGAHIYGKPIHGAEAFTATDAEKWQGHPGNIKELGDWAFCAGVNRFVFHRYALQPWADVKPGVSMGPWGLHYERTQTWWEQSRAWHAYLARCQYLLQQGLCVADLCYLMPENAPQAFHSPVKGGHERPGYSFDGCPPEAALSRLSVRDGRLVLPDGMSYRLLVLPRTAAMTPRLLRKVRELVEAGATVLGNPPERALGLAGYPQSDGEVRGLAREIWGDGAVPAELAERPFGKGRVIWGRELAPKPDADYVADNALGSAQWIWFNEGRPEQSAPVGKRYFRREVVLEPGDAVRSARLSLTADNAFEAWVNGRKVGEGDHFNRTYVMSVGHLLKPGTNVVAVAAENTTDHPNPAGLIGALAVRFASGRALTLATDGAWAAAKTGEGAWRTAAAWPGSGAARVLGPLGMRPWGELEEAPVGDPDATVDIAVASRAMERLGVAPDFAGEVGGQPAGLRYIHKRIGETDVYFVANREGVCRDATCAFRVTGRRPEIWRPDSGKVEEAASFEQTQSGVRMPLRLDPYGSLFVVFRKPAAGADPVVAVSCDGDNVFPAPVSVGDFKVLKAQYGVLDDPSATRDVTAKVGALLAKGGWSFSVTDMAKDEDPAYGQVKTLRVDFVSGGETGTVSRTDGQTVVILPPAAAQTAAVTCGQNGAVVLETGRAGRYAVRRASGRTSTVDVPAAPAPLSLSEDWSVEFSPNAGAPARIALQKLASWSEQADPGVRYFSGTATYRKAFDVPASTVGGGRRLCLDLGRVEVMAEVTLNGKTFDVLWKRPYALDVTEAVRAGSNALEIRVVNLWINRLIGDEQLSDDSPREKNGRTLSEWPGWLTAGKPSPTGRFTFTSHRLWKKDDPLVPSGLLGPVLLRSVERVPLP